MTTDKKTAYVDFNIAVGGIDTSIRIFEIETHVFVYVNQHPAEMHLYNDLLRAEIKKNCKNLKNKEFTVICNLSSHEALNPIAEHIKEILSE